MEKDRFGQDHDDSYLSLKRKMNEKALEISSTGYGLESVSKETEEDHKSAKTENENSSCGGL